MAVPLRMLVAGAGAMGRAWLATLRADRRWSVTAIADTAPAVLAAAGAAAAIPPEQRFLDAHAALAAPRPDALLVVSPPEAHRELCVAALDGGTPVFCGQPLAHTLADSVAVVAAARRTQTLLEDILHSLALTSAAVTSARIGHPNITAHFEEAGWTAGAGAHGGKW